jgi:hypothetical protein
MEKKNGLDYASTPKGKVKTQMKRVQEGKLKRKKNVIVVPFVACVTIYSQNSFSKETRVI